MSRYFAEALRDDLMALIEGQIRRRPALPTAQFLARSQIEQNESSFLDRSQVGYLHRLASRRAGLFALIGPEGCGKSAVMCATARRLASEGRIKFVAAFAPGGFRNWIGAFKSVLAQLGDQQRNVSPGPAALSLRFHEAVGATGMLAPLCILIDDVEIDPDGLEELAWLPNGLPHVVVIVAVRGGDREAESARSRGYSVIPMEPPDKAFSRTMIERRLLVYGRRLDGRQLGCLVSKSRSARDSLILSEEVRQTQRCEDLDASIEELAALDGSDALAGRGLARVLNGRAWAGQLLLALATSEIGLSDETLRQIARDQGARGAQLDIRLLREAIGDYATEAVGRTVLVNPAFRRVILTGCSEEDRRRARRIVMDSCLARLDAPGSPEEILTQAKAIGNWREFANLIARPDLAEALMRQAPEALAAAWSELSAHGSAVPERVYDAWAGVEPPSRVALAAEFLVARGALLAAERCAKDAAGRAAQTDIATRVRAQLVLARVAETGGRLNEAETYTSGVAEVASIAGDGAMRALAAANILRLIFLRDGASAAASRTAAVRSLAAQYPDGRALATVTLVEGLAALDGKDLSAARTHFEELKHLALRDDDFAASAAAEAGLARAEFERGRRKSAERRARTVEAIGELLGDSRLVLEGLAIRTAVAIDDVARFQEARELIDMRRRRAGEAGDEIALIEADMDDAILMAGQAELRPAARERALRAMGRARALGHHRLEAKILHLLGSGKVSYIPPNHD